MSPVTTLTEFSSVPVSLILVGWEGRTRVMDKLFLFLRVWDSEELPGRSFSLGASFTSEPDIDQEFVAVDTESYDLLRKCSSEINVQERDGNKIGNGKRRSEGVVLGDLMCCQSLECTSDTQPHTLRHSLEKGSLISSQHAEELGNGCTFQEKEI